MEKINNKLGPTSDLAAAPEDCPKDSPNDSMVEITTYIREDQAWALETMGFLRELALGVNFDKSTLIREALDLLFEKYDVKPGKWPDKRPAI